MERIFVSSSNLSSVGYDPTSRMLEVQFRNGSIYRYTNVPYSVHQGLMNAPSKGRYLDRMVKGVYRFTRVA